MTKKFDVVIGNPPYQEEAQGDGTRDTPIYHRFMDAAYEVGTKAVLITPARFLFNAGFTPKAWNEKMLADEHLSVAHYEPDSNRLFPGLTDPIKAGIAVTYRDSESKLGPIGFFTGHPELNAILHKVRESGTAFIETIGVTELAVIPRTPTSCTRTTRTHSRCVPRATPPWSIPTPSSMFSFLYSDDKPGDGKEYVQLLGVIKNKRAARWIRSDYITGPDSFDQVQGLGTGSERLRFDDGLFRRRVEQPDRGRAGGRGHADVHHHRLLRRPKPRPRRA